MDTQTHKLQTKNSMDIDSNYSSMDIDSNSEVWPPTELQQQIDELQNSKEINSIISSDDNLNKKMQLLMVVMGFIYSSNFYLHTQLRRSYSGLDP